MRAFGPEIMFCHHCIYIGRPFPLVLFSDLFVYEKHFGATTPLLLDLTERPLSSNLLFLEATERKESYLSKKRNHLCISRSAKIGMSSLVAWCELQKPCRAEL